MRAGTIPCQHSVEWPHHPCHPSSAHGQCSAAGLQSQGWPSWGNQADFEPSAFPDGSDDCLYLPSNDPSVFGLGCSTTKATLMLPQGIEIESLGLRFENPGGISTSQVLAKAPRGLDGGDKEHKRLSRSSRVTIQLMHNTSRIPYC